MKRICVYTNYVRTPEPATNYQRERCLAAGDSGVVYINNTLLASSRDATINEPLVPDSKKNARHTPFT